MNSSNRGHLGLGEVFDAAAERGRPVRFTLSRPFDLAPSAGVEHDLDSLAGLVREASGWLHAAGCRAGQRVAVIKDNHWDYVLLACAAARLGAVPALVSAELPPEAAALLLKRLDPAVLVTTGAVLRRARAAGSDLASPAPRTLLLDEPEAEFGAWAEHGSAARVLHLAELRGAPVPGPVRRDPHAPMVITHTSGTTGLPKLVVHSGHTAVGHLGRTESVRWPVVSMRRDDTVAVSLPFWHVRILPWTTGLLKLAPKRVLILADPEPAAAAPLLRSGRPTHVEALPSTYLRWQTLADQPDQPFDRVRLYISTFDAVHPPTVRCFLAASRRRFPVWFQGWGQSETGPLAFRLFTRSALARLGERHPTTRDLGRPIPLLTRLRVVDPATSRPAAPGQPGLVFARTNGRCLSYVDEHDRWLAKADGGWWNTGDLGTRSRSGRIRLLDREVDQIPRMSGVEVEDVLADRLPEVVEAVVLGVPGGLPVPVLCTGDGRLEPGRWRHATRDLPALGEPVVLRPDALPRTGTGKVRRQELRDSLLRLGAGHGTGRWT